MNALHFVHRSLHALGKNIGQLVLIALAIGLFIMPLGTILIASLFAAAYVGNLLGGGTLVTFFLFWIPVVLTGLYVAPHVQPQLGAAFSELLKQR